MFIAISKIYAFDNTEAILKKTKQFDFFKGSWSQKYFFSNGSDRPYAGEGSMEAKLINKNYIIEMDCQMPIERDIFIRKIYLGYDIITDKYYVVFLDANSTAPFYGTGIYYPDSKTYSFIGKYNESETYVVELKVIFKIERDDKFVYSVTKIDGPKEEKVLEVGNFKNEIPSKHMKKK